MKKIIAAVLAGVLAAGTVAIAVSADDFSGLNKEVGTLSSANGGAFVPSVAQKEGCVLTRAYFEDDETHERFDLKVLIMNSNDEENNALMEEKGLALQVTSLNAILDEERDNGIPEESADLTRRLHAALLQAGSLDAFMAALPEGGIENLRSAGFNAENHTVFAMYNLQPSETLARRLGEGGRVFFELNILGMTEGTGVDMLFMDSMQSGVMLEHRVAVTSTEYEDACKVDVESPALGTLFVITEK